MPYTFGASNADDANIGSTQTALATGTMFYVAGWFRPTTLTAGRTLWSVGSTANCAVIGATTSELELLVDYTTTDGKWTTSGMALTVNAWTFIAVIISNLNSGPSMAARVWAGTIDQAPREITCTQTTAPVGTVVGTSTWYIGNKGTGLLAFQGDISDVAMMHSTGTGKDAALSIPATQGTITQDEADLFRQLYVEPAWRGDHALAFERRGGPGSATAPTARWFTELNDGGQVIGRPLTAVSPELALTINGATVASGCPRPAQTRPSWPWRKR